MSTARSHQARRAVTPGHATHAQGFASLRPIVLGLARLLALPLASAAPLHVLDHAVHASKEEEEHGTGSLLVYLIVAVVLVLLGGVFAGLTIALMGQDETYLQVIASSGEGSERGHAIKVLNLLKKGKHWVLVTLLLSNVITNETLPIVLDRSLGGGWPAVVSSTVLIVIFGEVAPQSVCVRYGLSIGAYMAPFVLALMWIMFPIAWPTAKLLDWLLGEDHGTTYKKAGLKTLVSLHKTLGANTERLLEDEVNIINSVLDLKEKPVGDIITPMQDVFTMSADTVLDEKMMDTILSQGYSRIPIHTPDNYRNFVGMLLVKILITYDPEDCKRVGEFALATLPETAPYTSCLDIINFFQEGKSHMVLVSDFPGEEKGALGVVTLEDVIEELIGEEIIDESDVFIDVHKAIRRLAPAPKTRFGKYADPVVDDTDHETREAGEDEPLLAPDQVDSSRRPNIRSNHTTFLMRRKSSNASEPALKDANKPVSVRSNTADMREHLKHLGPSNVASKPRATKYTSVKIKPGVGTIPEHHATTVGIDAPERSQSADPDSRRNGKGETTGLLKSDGASDGVATVQAGYGTLQTSSAKRRLSEELGSPSDRMSAAEASKLAREHTPSSPARPVSAPTIKEPTSDDSSEPPNGSPERTNGSTAGLLHPPEKLVIGNGGSSISTDADNGNDNGDDENDALGEMSGLPRDRSKDRRVARSGSITQTTVDAGGLKKIVLETTSSSDDLDDGTRSPSPRVDHQLDGAGPDGSSAAEGGAPNKKKRKKRGKKKKAGE